MAAVEWYRKRYHELEHIKFQIRKLELECEQIRLWDTFPEFYSLAETSQARPFHEIWPEIEQLKKRIDPIRLDIADTAQMDLIDPRDEPIRLPTRFTELTEIQLEQLDADLMRSMASVRAQLQAIHNKRTKEQSKNEA